MTYPSVKTCSLCSVRSSNTNKHTRINNNNYCFYGLLYFLANLAMLSGECCTHFPSFSIFYVADYSEGTYYILMWLNITKILTTFFLCTSTSSLSANVTFVS